MVILKPAIFDYNCFKKFIVVLKSVPTFCAIHEEMPILMARLTVPFCKGDKFTEPGLTFNGADRSGKKRFYSIDPLASHFLNRRSQLLLTSIKKKKKNS